MIGGVREASRALTAPSRVSAKVASIPSYRSSALAAAPISPVASLQMPARSR